MLGIDHALLPVDHGSALKLWSRFIGDEKATKLTQSVDAGLKDAYTRGVKRNSVENALFEGWELGWNAATLAAFATASRQANRLFSSSFVNWVMGRRL